MALPAQDVIHEFARGGGIGGPRHDPHLLQSFDFRNGKLWPNARPGLGVEFDPRAAKLIAEITERARPTPLFHRPDGSITNW